MLYRFIGPLETVWVAERLRRSHVAPGWEGGGESETRQGSSWSHMGRNEWTSVSLSLEIQAANGVPRVPLSLLQLRQVC